VLGVINLGLKGLFMVVAGLLLWSIWLHILRGEPIIELSGSWQAGETGMRWGPWPAWVTITLPWASKTCSNLSANMGSYFILCWTSYRTSASVGSTRCFLFGCLFSEFFPERIWEKVFKEGGLNFDTPKADSLTLLVVTSSLFLSFGSAFSV
jgi:hypothetical protein